MIPHLPALRINGTSNAYAPQFGCGCPRCLTPDANTSVSLVSRRPDGDPFHLLVDCGRGVAASIARDPWLGGRPLLDMVALTHWHGDHTLDLGLVLPGLARTRARNGETSRPKLWMRRETAAWVERDSPFLFQSDLADMIVDRSGAAPGTLLPPLELDCDLNVQPFTVSHSSADVGWPYGNPVSCCAGFIVESATRKTVILWDIDGANDWIDAPADERERTMVDRLRGCDLLLVDCDSFTGGTAERPATHASLADVARYAAAIEPEQTLLVHLSGHSDPDGSGFGWTDDQWDAAAARVWREHGLRGSVRAARQGEWLPL